VALGCGARLGPYEILNAIGAGGMGEVYKALDTRLNRVVALKALSAEFKNHPDRRARFLREAQAVAALEHPHICVLHDIGHDADLDFLVMEFLEGETLAARLARGAIPLEEILRYAAEIGAALQCAHRHGIVHRALKPANIMLTGSGAKLLDFGLAKLRGPEAIAGISAILSTQAAPLTISGTILGTLHYMAPEQLEGRDADARSDLFAFGAVFYEMITGARPFDGQSAASLIASIFEHEPIPMVTLRARTPPQLDPIVRRCLAKNPDDRWQTASDLTFELSSQMPLGIVVDPAANAAPQTNRRATSAVAAALVVAAASLSIATFALMRSSSGSEARAPMRFLLSEQPPASFASENQRAFAISRDGARVAYVAEVCAGCTFEIFARWRRRHCLAQRGRLHHSFHPMASGLRFLPIAV